MCSVLREMNSAQMWLLLGSFSGAKLMHFYLQFPMFVRVENGIIVFILCTDTIIWQFHYVASKNEMQFTLWFRRSTEDIHTFS